MALAELKQPNGDRAHPPAGSRLDRGKLLMAHADAHGSHPWPRGGGARWARASMQRRGAVVGVKGGSLAYLGQCVTSCKHQAAASCFSRGSHCSAFRGPGVALTCTTPRAGPKSEGRAPSRDGQPIGRSPEPVESMCLAALHPALHCCTDNVDMSADLMTWGQSQHHDNSGPTACCCSSGGATRPQQPPYIMLPSFPCGHSAVRLLRPLP